MVSGLARCLSCNNRRGLVCRSVLAIGRVQASSQFPRQTAGALSPVLGTRTVLTTASSVTATATHL